MDLGVHGVAHAARTVWCVDDAACVCSAANNQSTQLAISDRRLAARRLPVINLLLIKLPPPPQLMRTDTEDLRGADHMYEHRRRVATRAHCYQHNASSRLIAPEQKGVEEPKSA